MSPLKVGLLGCGGIANRHAEAMKSLAGQMELVACCGRDPDRTAAFAQPRGARAYTDVDAMLAAERLDLVIATLPPFNRNGEIERIAQAGVHLLVEKPIALDEESAMRMVEAVEASGVIAGIGFMYRFGDAIRRWKAEDTGAPGLFSGSYHCNALHAEWWREEATSGGQIVEQVIHQIDLIRHMIGEPDHVYARRANLFHRDVPRYDVEDVSSIVFGWNDGRIATLTGANIAVPGLWFKQWAVLAEKMTGRFVDWNIAELTHTQGEVKSEAIAGTTDVFAAQLADIADAIRNRRAPYIPLREGAATLRLALAARRAADERREIDLSRHG
jgi:predicted dehydrogenase